jgi:hypothetical protein
VKSDRSLNMEFALLLALVVLMIAVALRSGWQAISNWF